MGGAKNCPETPRQKMIGMMYLVLTAMLALNVSTDILNGFTMVNNSLHESIEATDRRNFMMMRNFYAAAVDNPEKNQEWYEKATEMVAKSDSLYDYIHNFKYEIAKLADGAEKADTTVRVVQGLSNLDVTGEYAMTKGNGAILRQKINAYREYLISIAPQDSVEWNTFFATPAGTTNDGQPISWEATLFEGMPVGASITLLTKIQNDIRTAESELIQHLQISTDASDLRVNKMEALVVPESKYVIKGSKYAAKIVLAAIDTTQTPIYFVGNTQLGEDGVYTVSANTVGPQKYTGHILVKGHDGEDAAYPFESEYSVSEPFASIANEDLTVMYRGFDNRFRISVPGVPDANLRISATGAEQPRRVAGFWVINPKKNVDNVQVIVSADMDGKVQEMGRQTYRVKPLPDPGAYVVAYGKTYAMGSEIPRGALLDSKTVINAGYGEDVLVQMDWNVVSFTLRVNGKSAKSSGSALSAAQKDLLQKARKGDGVFIEKIMVKGAKDTQQLKGTILLMLS